MGLFYQWISATSGAAHVSWPAKCTKEVRKAPGDSRMGRQKGFSLIELLIVVAIILIIAAIAIPNLLRARIAANESSAASGVRTVNTAEVSFNSSYPTVGYAAALADLGDAAGTCQTTAPTATNACLIDNSLAGATAAPGKSGYIYQYGV